MGNLEEIDNFLESAFSQYRTMKKSGKYKQTIDPDQYEIGSVIKTLPTNEVQDQITSQLNYSKNFEKS